MSVFRIVLEPFVERWAGESAKFALILRFDFVLSELRNYSGFNLKAFVQINPILRKSDLFYWDIPPFEGKQPIKINVPN
jgi:hypothetical protein